MGPHAASLSDAVRHCRPSHHAVQHEGRVVFSQSVGGLGTVPHEAVTLERRGSVRTSPQCRFAERCACALDQSAERRRTFGPSISSITTRSDCDDVLRLACLRTPARVAGVSRQKCVVPRRGGDAYRARCTQQRLDGSARVAAPPRVHLLRLVRRDASSPFPDARDRRGSGGVPTCAACALVAPAGFGKTAVASQLIAWAVDRGHRVLFIVHRREIVMDTAQRLTTRRPCGVIASRRAARRRRRAGRIRANRGGARGSSARGPSRVGRGRITRRRGRYRDIAAQYPKA